MKKSKRILSAVAVVLLAVSLLIPLYASALVPAEQLKQMGFVAYRVLDREESTIPSEEEDDNNKVYTVNEDFADFFAGITPEAYEAGIRNDEIMLTVDEDGNLKIVSNEEEIPGDDNVIILPVNDTVNANTAEVLAGVLLSEIETSSAKASDAQRLAGWLKAYAEGKKNAENSNWPEHQDEVTVEANEDGVIDIGDLEYGYWLVYSTKQVAGVSNVKVVLEVGEDSQSTIRVKAEYDGLEKTVRNLTDEDDTFEKTAQADAGDILEYRVEFDIQPLDEYPALDGQTYTKFKFVFSDTLTNQRLVNYRNNETTVSGTEEKQGAFLIKVEVNGSVRYYVDVDSSAITESFKRSLGLPTSANVQPLTNLRNTEEGAINYGTYEFVPDEEGEEGEGSYQQTFTIDFNWGALKTLVSEFGAHVTFMYKAELASDAILKNPNQVTLEYSSNPNNQEETTENTDTTTVFSFGLDITKTFAGENGDEDLWKDVVFNLFEASLPSGEAPADLVEGNRIAFVERVKGVPGDYQRADSVDRAQADPEDAPYDLKLSETSNTLNLYGLDPGYYVLEETSSPNGYLLGGKVYIYVAENGNILTDANSKLWLGEEDITEGAITGTDTDNETKDSLEISIDNMKRDFELPETGAMGVWLFGIGGVLVIASAVFLYNMLKKRGQHN